MWKPVLVLPEHIACCQYLYIWCALFQLWFRSSVFLLFMRDIRWVFNIESIKCFLKSAPLKQNQKQIIKINFSLLKYVEPLKISLYSGAPGQAWSSDFAFPFSFLVEEEVFPSKQFWKRPAELGGLFCWSSFGQDWSSTGHGVLILLYLLELIFRIGFPNLRGICSPGKNRRWELLGPVQSLLLGRGSHVKGGGRKEPK